MDYPRLAASSLRDPFGKEAPLGRAGTMDYFYSLRLIVEEDLRLSGEAVWV
jgi:hypothetical protein